MELTAGTSCQTRSNSAWRPHQMLGHIAEPSQSHTEDPPSRHCTSKRARDMRNWRGHWKSRKRCLLVFFSSPERVTIRWLPGSYLPSGCSVVVWWLLGGYRVVTWPQYRTKCYRAKIILCPSVCEFHRPLWRYLVTWWLPGCLVATWWLLVVTWWLLAGWSVLTCRLCGNLTSLSALMCALLCNDESSFELV